MLIQNAQIYQHNQKTLHTNDVRIEQGKIVEIGALSPYSNETIFDATGGALLPGLNDHHIHFLSYAASLASLNCSPAATEQTKLHTQLQQHNGASKDWLRGYGYHESVAGEIDCRWLDQYCPTRPTRIQHRTGRLWIFNSAGLAIVKNALAHHESITINPEAFKTGRFYDSDEALATLLGKTLPPVELASETLARYGITGFTDMTPSNNEETYSLFENLTNENRLLQHTNLAKRTPFSIESTLQQGPVKIHLHETQLPPLEELVQRIKNSHAQRVPVAIHCVTEIELLFSLSALEEAQPIAGDRIEHASITPDYLLEKIIDLGLTVVTQPHFIHEKGDTYLEDIPEDQWHSLYRCNSFLQKQVPLAAGSDAPFGSADPWQAIRAAISRKTRAGKRLGQEEALTPETALALFLGSLSQPQQPRSVCVGTIADLCLLTYPWEQSRDRLIKEDVRMVWRSGNIIYNRS